MFRTSNPALKEETFRGLPRERGADAMTFKAPSTRRASRSSSCSPPPPSVESVPRARPWMPLSGRGPGRTRRRPHDRIQEGMGADHDAALRRARGAGPRRISLIFEPSSRASSSTPWASPSAPWRRFCSPTARGSSAPRENFKLGVVAATGAIAFSISSRWAGLLRHSIPFIHGSGPIGIGFSVFVVVLAALNLVLDFDFIENGAPSAGPEVHGVVRGLRPARDADLALSGDPAAPGEAPGPRPPLTRQAAAGVPGRARPSARSGGSWCVPTASQSV